VCECVCVRVRACESVCVAFKVNIVSQLRVEPIYTLLPETALLHYIQLTLWSAGWYFYAKEVSKASENIEH